MYNEPQIIDGNKIFLVKRSELEGRLDAQYYNTSISIPHNIKLSSFAIVKGGKRIPKGYSYSDAVTPYYYLRVADMGADADINYAELKCIDDKVYNILKKYEIKENELAISIAGTIGKVNVLHDIPLGHKVILTENCAKLLIKEKKGLQIDYLKILFTIPLIQKQLQWNYIQTTIPKLGLDRIQNLRFPPIPSLEFQRQIIQMMNSAYSEKKSKESEAQQQLESIDTYLLNELGITLPVIGNTLDDRIFILNRSNLEARLDPISYYFDIKTFTQCTYSERLFDLVLSFDNGFAVGRQNQVEEETGILQIRPTNIDNYGRLTFEKNVYVPEKEDVPFVKTGVVLFNNTNSQEWVGKTAYFANEEGRNVYTSNHITAINVDRSKILPEYLCAILNMYQRHRVFYSICTNWNNQSGIGLDLLKSLHIPLLSDNKEESLRRQQQIVDRINSKYKKADDCIAFANHLMSDAKAEVESMIIG